MTRKTTQWPTVNRGDYDRWRRDFEGGPSVRKVLAKFAPEAEPEAEHIRTLLYAAKIGPRKLTREQATHNLPQLNTRINLTDYIITWLAERLKGKTRRVNEDIAALLTAAGVPVERSAACAWTAEGVKKRRARIGSLWVSTWGPRFLLSRQSVRLLRARQRE